MIGRDSFIEIRNIFFTMIALALTWRMFWMIKRSVALCIERTEEQKITEAVYADRKRMFGMKANETNVGIQF